MKNGLKIFGIVILSLLASAMLVYCLIAPSFRNVFFWRTVVNGRNVGGLTIDEANEALKNTKEHYQLTMKLSEHEKETLKGEHIGYTVDYSKELKSLMSAQNPFLWGYAVLNPAAYERKPERSCKEELLKEQLASLACFQIKKQNAACKVLIEKKPLGYQLHDETKEEIQEEKAFSKITSAITDGESVVDLSDCYVSYQPTEEVQEVYDKWEKIKKLQNVHIVFKDGDLETALNAVSIVDFMEKDGTGLPLFDESGRIVLNDDRIRYYIGKLAKKFNTDGKKRIWEKINGGTVELKTSDTGYQIDEEAIFDFIKESVSEGKSATVRPMYVKEGKGRGREEFGDSYIEVDMSAQKLYYFEDGTVHLTTDIVTGNLSRRCGTPAKICSVYGKEKNRVLRGANYASFVYYWMPVSGNIGIHDATWRDEFGGEIYKTAGSHGCINLPKDKAGELYEHVTIGTPVIMYY